jgi:hypothetical protein
MRSSISDLVQERLAGLSNREQERFWCERPRSVELRRRGLESMPIGVPMSWFVSVYHQDPLYISYGEGAHIVDVEGPRYLDTNVGDMSTFCGYAPPAVTEAIAARATRGVQFMLPVEDSPWVAEELGRRFGLSRWQFTPETCGRRSSARGLRPRWPPPARTWITTWPCWKSSSVIWRRETIARTRVT